MKKKFNLSVDELLELRSILGNVGENPIEAVGRDMIHTMFKDIQMVQTLYFKSLLNDDIPPIFTPYCDELVVKMVSLIAHIALPLDRQEGIDISYNNLREEGIVIFSVLTQCPSVGYTQLVDNTFSKYALAIFKTFMESKKCLYTGKLSSLQLDVIKSLLVFHNSTMKTILHEALSAHLDILAEDLVCQYINNDDYIKKFHYVVDIEEDSITLAGLNEDS